MARKTTKRTNPAAKGNVISGNTFHGGAGVRLTAEGPVVKERRKVPDQVIQLIYEYEGQSHIQAREDSRYNRIRKDQSFRNLIELIESFGNS